MLTFENSSFALTGEMKWAEKIVLFMAGNYEQVLLADKDKQQKYVKVWTTYSVPNNIVFAQNEVFQLLTTPGDQILCLFFLLWVINGIPKLENSSQTIINLNTQCWLNRTHFEIF